MSDSQEQGTSQESSESMEHALEVGMSYTMTAEADLGVASVSTEMNFSGSYGYTSATDETVAQDARTAMA